MRTVTDLDGVTKKWKTGGIQSDRASRPTSAPHAQARQLLKEMFPTMIVLEEVSIPIREKQILYADFFVPLLNILVEVDGRQHFEYCPHYHGSRAGFAKQKKRDAEKQEWADINNIKIIRLADSETEDEWRTKLERRND